MSINEAVLCLPTQQIIAWWSIYARGVALLVPSEFLLLFLVELWLVKLYE